MKPRANILFRLAWSPALLTLAFYDSAFAELYTYTDPEGVVHFTNIPRGSHAQPHKIDKKSNTFLWQKDAGELLRVHRVDVRRFDPTIVAAAEYYSLPPALIKAVIAAESAFEPSAISHAGAQGLMQLMPATAERMRVVDPFEASQNIYGGSRYLRILANRFAGDLRLTTAAYNAGPEAVEKALGVPPWPETQDYVRRVLKLYQHYLQNWPEGIRRQLPP